MNIVPVKRALISVSNKSYILDLAKELIKLNVQIISTGGTSHLFIQEKIDHLQVEDVTKLPEIFDGRVKTLHPKIHGGILGRRDAHAQEASRYGLQWIDLVVVNFYPFLKAWKNDQLSFEQIIEYIDVGGPALARAAAKNFAWVGALVDPADYGETAAQLRNNGGLTLTTRKGLAQKAFAATSSYDDDINQFFLAQASQQNKEQATVFSRSPNQTSNHPSRLNLSLCKSAALRYGENPHQPAIAYQFTNPENQEEGILSARQIQGKPLSYNNIVDAETALHCVAEFARPACVIIKHAIPCGIACADHVHEAYIRAKTADAKSAFGGIVAFNQKCDQAAAEVINSIFTELVVAPSYTKEALKLFAQKPNLRVLQLPAASSNTWEMKWITGGLLMQEKERHSLVPADLQVVTKQKLNPQEIEMLLFAWQAVKHIKSNAIVLAKQNATIGIGAGQVSRINAVEIALMKAEGKTKESVLASDGFFPFRDSIDRLAGKGIRAIIQPGGSMRDQEVIEACDEEGIAMVFTGKRCFRH